jgi:hypothetical protein
MTAEEKPDDPPLSADDVLSELQAAGISPTRLNMQTFIAAARAAQVDDIDRRHRPHPLLALAPPELGEDCIRKWATRGELNAWKVGGRWFSDIASMESWIIAGDRLTEDALTRWRATMARRFP